MKPSTKTIAEWTVFYRSHNIEIEYFFYSVTDIVRKQAIACIRAVRGEKTTPLGWLTECTNFLATCGLSAEPDGPVVLPHFVPNGKPPARSVDLDNQWTSANGTYTDNDLRTTAHAMRDPDVYAPNIEILAPKIKQKARDYHLEASPPYLKKLEAHGYYGPMFSDANDTCQTLVPYLNAACI